MNIINPNFKINEDRNIFIIRKKEYDNILNTVAEILKPAEDLGFVINELVLKDSKFSSGELLKTLKQNLIIKLQKGNSEIDLSMVIPKLVDNNYIVINGRRKIPLFQLFDIPVVTRGKHIKLRTNITTIMISKKKEPPFVEISFLSKKISLALLMFAFYGAEHLNTVYNLDQINPSDETTNLYESFLYDLKMFYKESEGYTQDDFILEVGRIYSKYNMKSKGEDIIYALDLIPKVDILTSKFFKTNSILDEIIEVLKTGDLDDTLFTNKRVRCLEYVIFSKISKAIFDLCISNRSARQPKFNINSTQILSDCNVSDIVQFDFSINPIEELTKLSRISLLGPGGFKRENVPTHLRDIHDSMFGRICPVDTPDRDNCGILQNLIPNVKLDDNLKFESDYLKHQPISISVSLVPFCEHDDQTRLQMASSQMRQAIMLKNFEQPLIRSGCEGLYTDLTQFIKKSKKDGEVVYVGSQYLIVQYIDDEVEVFDISYRKIYVENMDFMNIYVTQGDKFKAGDILAESNFCKNGNINIGKNLLTAVMSYYGNNYEDGIVISKKLVDEDILTSVHNKNLSFILPVSRVLLSLSPDRYKPLPDQLEKIKNESPYAIIKEMSSFDLCSSFNEKVILKAEHDYIITDVNIYPNEWNDEIPEFKEWVEEKIEQQIDKENLLKKILKDNLGKENSSTFIRDNSLNKFSYTGKFKNKSERINGMLVEINSIFFRKVKVGDKLANRHGNKGVISQIVDHDKMPMTEDGQHVEICINPLGIISRMNLGQLFELQLTASLCSLKEKMIQMIKDKNQDQLKEYLLSYIKIIDNTKDNWYYNQFKKQLPDKIDEQFVKNLTLIQPPFESAITEKIKEALDYTNIQPDQKIFDPVSQQEIINRIAIGKIYFFRMVHIAEEKLAGRGLGAYSRKTLQPLGGRRQGKAQRCGEMETSCLIAHDTPINLFEFFTTKSDCIDLKNKYIKEFVNTDLIELPQEYDETPESVKLLNAYFTVLGIENDKRRTITK